jgi:curli biogenesis system outer membrane secretion channel CsgG
MLAASLIVPSLLMSQAPAWAQMKKSAPLRPGPTPAVVNPVAAPTPSPIQTMSTFKQQPEIEEDRPRLAVLQPRGQATNLYNNTLYSRIETGLFRLNRFTVVNRSQIEALLQERKLEGSVESDPAGVGRLVSAQRLIVVEMISDPTAAETTSETVTESTATSVSQSRETTPGSRNA